MDGKSIGLAFKTVIIMLQVGSWFLWSLTVMAKDPANSMSAPLQENPEMSDLTKLSTVV